MTITGLTNHFILLFVLIFVSQITADTILIIRSSGDNFSEVANSISLDLKEEFTIVEEIIDERISAKKTAKIINHHNPALIVLMNNNTIKNFKKYQQSLPDEAVRIPSLLLMSSLLSEEIKGLENSTGISYEVPIVTSVVNLRTILKIKDVKLGVVYRQFLRSFIERNAAYCKKEGIQMIRAFVPSGSANYTELLKTGLESFTSSQIGVNMIWVPNDPEFLTREAIRNVWVPFSEKHSLPIIVGVENMVSTNVNFGTYAVIPDHSALGQQAAELIYEIRDRGWYIDLNIVEPPISIYQILNPMKIKTKYQVDDEITDVDKVINR